MKRGRRGLLTRSRFGLFTRGLCLFLACTFFLGTQSLQVLADGSDLYGSLQSKVEDTWGQYDRTIEYTYDANGDGEKNLALKVPSGIIVLSEPKGFKITTIYIRERG